jgi:hypothetical protein
VASTVNGFEEASLEEPTIELEGAGGPLRHRVVSYRALIGLAGTGLVVAGVAIAVGSPVSVACSSSVKRTDWPLYICALFTGTPGWVSPWREIGSTLVTHSAKGGVDVKASLIGTGHTRYFLTPAAPVAKGFDVAARRNLGAMPLRDHREHQAACPGVRPDPPYDVLLA